MNPNRKMYEETGLFVGDEVRFRGEEWVVMGAVLTPKTTELHCISLARSDMGGKWSTAAHSSDIHSVELISPSPIEGEET